MDICREKWLLSKFYTPRCKGGDRRLPGGCVFEERVGVGAYNARKKYG